MEPLSVETANAIYDILVEECKASNNWRGDFVHHQTNGVCTEYRFQGALGFGGKFWRTTGRNSTGNWAEAWVVNQYPEDTTEHSIDMIDSANDRLYDLREEEE